MNKLFIFIYTLLVVIIVGFITFYFTLQNVCASETEVSCTPTLPIPTYEYLPTITDTPSVSPDVPTITVGPQVDTSTTVTQPTPTAGSSAVIVPIGAPQTGHAQ